MAADRKIAADVAVTVTGTEALTDAAEIVDELDGTVVDVEVAGADTAVVELGEVESIKDRIDGSPAVAEIDAMFGDTRQQLDAVQGDLDRIDDAYTAEVGVGGTAEAGRQLAQLGGQLLDLVANSGLLTDALGSIGGKASEVAGFGQQFAALGAPFAAAAPLALITSTAAGAIRDNMKEAAEVKALNTQNVQEFGKALQDGADAASVLKDRLKETGELQMATLLDGTEDVAPALYRAGVSVDQFTKAAGGGKESIGKLFDAMVKAGVGSEDLNIIFQGLSSTSEQMKTAAERQAIVTGILGDETEAAGAKAETAAGSTATFGDAAATAAGQAITASSSAADFAKALEGIDPVTTADIIAAFNEGEIERGNQMINDAARPRTAYVDLVLRGLNIGAQIGAAVNRSVTTAAANVTVNMPAGARGDDVVRAISATTSRSGDRFANP